VPYTTLELIAGSLKNLFAIMSIINWLGRLRRLNQQSLIWPGPNTVYMQAALAQLRAEGYPVHEADLASLSPAHFEHLNPFGTYYFPIDQARRREGLRTLRAA
jgi:Tn3 transposase DDE domain-containing protein